MELNHGYPLFNDVIDEPTLIEGMEEQLHTTWYISIIYYVISYEYAINMLGLGPYGHHFACDIFRTIFIEWFFFLHFDSLNFVPKCPNDNSLAMVQIIARWRICDKPLSEPTAAQYTAA